MDAPPAGTEALFGVDSITMMIAFGAAAIAVATRFFRGIQPVATRRKIINDFLNGSVIFPFGLLVFSVFSNKVFAYIETSKFTVSLAGGVGVIFVVGELVLSCSHEKHQDDPGNR